MWKKGAAGLLALAAITLGACERKDPNAIPFDIREVMLSSANANDRTFPEGKEVALTHFAYIGTVTTSLGLIRVVACRSVIANMPSPRGQAWLSFHSEDGTWISSRDYNVFAPPLWCEGSRVYFFGIQGAGEDSGNALDLQDGVDAARWVTEHRAGSLTNSSGER